MSSRPADWRRVREIFEGTAQLPADARPDYLSRTCGDDDALRREVEALLASHEGAKSFLEEPAVPAVIDSAPAHLEGRRIGPYQLAARIGAGGMGEVYRARDVKLGRDVAIKMLPPRLTADPERLARFEREARVLATLNHPNIGPIYGLEDADGMPALVLELIEGETLADRLQRGPVPVSDTLAIARQIAAALEAAHEKGIIHRDLKPANIKITPAGVVKVLDFGLAKATVGEVASGPDSSRSQMITSSDIRERSPAPETIRGVIMGTGGYMSPEQASGESVDARTDVFSFGIVLYEMLTGARPFAGDSYGSTLRAVLQEQPKPVQDVRSDVPRDLQRIVARCLEKDPAKRYGSAVEVHRDLANVALPGAAASERSFRRYVRIAGAAVLVILTIAALGVWMFVRRARAEVERKAAIAEVERLVDRGRFVDVWRAAQSALRRWPGDPQFEQLLGSTTMTVTIASDPPAADVAFKAYDDVSGDWIALGTSPLNGVRAPLGMLRWRVTKSGFEPLEARLEVGTPAAAAGRPDVDAPPLRLRRIGSDVAHMVFVPGGGYGGGRLTDYWLDQTEVTNRDFKGFLDRGAYENPRYWPELRGGAESAAARFRDRTGRPGPSTWELGTYPEGHDEHPVNGVSWFEAVAFCRAAGKSLPTVSHWRKAFGATFFMEVVALGNFGGRGPASVRQLKDVGPWGTYGMSGNVKEWVWNELEGRRYILGGAWNEPVYMATNDDVRPAEDRAETNGFRCVNESAPSDAAAYAASARSAPRDYTKEKPVDAATFEIFRRFYSYDRTPLDARTEQTQEFGEWRRERVSFAAAYGGERVLANLLIPKNAAPPYQAVIWFPGSYARMLKRSDEDLPFSYYFDFLPRSGRALVYPVYQGTYERRVSSPLPQSSSLYRDLVVQWSKDLSRTIDYLESRSDFDPNKLAYYGFSMGAAAAIPAVALEPRLKTVILLTGGVYQATPASPEVEILNFAPRITAPVLMLGGRYDFSLPVETSQKPLFNLLGTPPAHKRHVIFEGAGHVPPRLDVIREVLAWLDRYLGPVDRRTR